MKTCKITDCEVKHYAKGYCQRHYKQYQRHGLITNAEAVKKYEECYCWSPHYAKGFCKNHYYQIKNHGRIIID